MKTGQLINTLLLAQDLLKMHFLSIHWKTRCHYEPPEATSHVPIATSCKGTSKSQKVWHRARAGEGSPCHRTHLPLGTVLIQFLPIGVHILCECQRSEDPTECAGFVPMGEMTRKKCTMSRGDKGLKKQIKQGSGSDRGLVVAHI